MAKVADKLDVIEQTIMSGLKDFQQATVNRIDQLYRNGQMRILVSDEVGLGKTLIARGTIAKLARIQKEAHDKLVKVVYICSNVAIAEQNLNKLRITHLCMFYNRQEGNIRKCRLNYLKINISQIVR